MKPKDLKHQLVVDVALAAALVGFVLIVSPGLAIVGMLALVVLVVGSAGFVIELASGRRRPKSRLREDRWGSRANGRAGRRSGLS
ncbi:MAG: hypothetical protein ACTHQQ_20425 [Solirubrobacteraceae bacterium]